MGATPRLALLSLALPAGAAARTTSTRWSAAWPRSPRATACTSAGGNLTRSPGPLVIDVTVIGTVKRRQVLTRGGARPGDELYVTGSIGAAAARARRCCSAADAGRGAGDRASCTERLSLSRSRGCGLGTLLGAEPRGHARAWI